MQVDHTIDHKCSGCGDCCTSVLLVNDYEIKKLKQFIQRNEIVPDHNNEHVCPFLTSDEHRCQVYVKRPKICESFQCDRHLPPTFPHRDKKIVSFWQTFYPDSPTGKQVDTQKIEMLNTAYQMKKAEAFGDSK